GRMVALAGPQNSGANDPRGAEGNGRRVSARPAALMRSSSHVGPVHNRLARNTASMILGLGLRFIIQALYFIEIARSLGAANYGAFVGVVALVGIAYPFGALGSGNLLIKNVSRDRSTFAARWGSALVTIAVSGSLLLG